MKRIISIITLLFYSITAGAQTYNLFPRDRGITTELLRSTVATIVLYIIASFIISMTRMILNDRLKKKMLEKGVSGEVIAQMLPPRNELAIAAKWISILSAISVGFLIISFFPPGIHSVIIMTACVALGHLAFYLWAKRLKN
jgi:hypothetical protein